MIVAIIPARYNSSRFPGKALVTLGGTPLVALVLQGALRAGVADQVWLATDDARIAAVAARWCPGVRTHLDERSAFACGSDRVAALAATLGLGAGDAVLNVQGDEPCVEVEILTGALEALGLVGAEIGTVGAPLDGAAVDDPDLVKLVVGPDGIARAFSRRRLAPDQAPEQLAHVGVYAFTPVALRRFAALPPGRAEREQRLEQLRAMEHGMRIGVRTVRRATIAINRPEDLAQAEAALG